MEGEKNQEFNRSDQPTSRLARPTGRQACEVYSRVVGYIRPVASWNPGKQSEYKDRLTYKVCQDSGA
ncbi:MAG: hypothetical protein A3B89_02610 [Candidatus Buchananbacteria bacterium RIFCSPHIGHO2_02_FULL_40_13]|uniref:Uncharacterized protein n=1 Tax=Candidatus Buchananbacteria bacterium RIFCSPLOWO2_01_FULL_39_33 TaxID=1797543 RepID=A0A1G1YKG7_9BACT|nr:MAG: hypothetical protein A2820_02385 [Candidatus Buchananbacteria bacterium RIFCSPHIGHO2_01_FULL_40_35]OGY49902.1 MAG: hypothetical protein A3B89_02610 [Candidatus Buchananbacteria bacterium RIFCSPHIGHO2_02_FULL_40_13]OGY51957.1 MAG: hypothetical protein A3A02_01470 [Candidatus Buchananbacteria bacterium RIFCSPLOWO2_01_FULL_39_33]